MKILYDSKKRSYLLFVFVLMIAIYSIADHINFLYSQKDEILTLYEEKQQKLTELFAFNMKEEIEKQENWNHNWLDIIPIIRNKVESDKAGWLYVICNEKVVFYKNQDLEKDHAEISHQNFIENRKNSSVVLTQQPIEVNGETYIVGYVKTQKSVLIESGFNQIFVMLLLEIIITMLLLAMIVFWLLWKNHKLSGVIKKEKDEIVELNNKLERRNQDLNEQLEKETELKYSDREDVRYDKKLLHILLEKANEAKYLPIGMLLVRFYMGKIYFTKTQMKFIEKQLQEQARGKCEVFEIGKGEFLFLMINMDIQEIDEVFKQIKQEAEIIALNNKIEVRTSTRTIMDAETNLNEVLEKEIKNVSFS